MGTSLKLRQDLKEGQYNMCVYYYTYTISIIPV